ncbi:MAG: MFS transporter [Pirellulales bacterium]|nr:MFS transporter [Pirellulales bacterium]
MNPPEDALPCPETPHDDGRWPTHPELASHESRNLLVLALQQVLFRIGWIFKTESVVMPAFLDLVSGAGWLRGCLPVINRFGQSLPPVFWADRLRATPYKKRALAVFIFLMSGPFVVLSGVWFAVRFYNVEYRASWLAALFLGLYLVFFLVAGFYRIGYGTLQGKLIRPTRRGQLLWLSTMWGTLPAIGFVLWFMPEWLRSDIPAFGPIFASVAIGFLLSGLCALMAFEPADRDQAPPTAAVRGMVDSLRVLGGDANLRRLVLVIMLTNMGIILFPHYQSLAREKLGLSGMSMIAWLVAQNVGIGVFSVLIGCLADARGYRLTLQLLIVGSVAAPLLALGLAGIGQPWGGRFYWCVFIMLGVIPLGLQATMNYTLEICRTDQHARYLSTVNLCTAAPFLFSPLVGWAIDAAGYNVVFTGAVVSILAGAVLSLGLKEPRHRLEPEEAMPLDVGTEG